VSLSLHDHPTHAAQLLLTLVPHAGGQLAAWLRVRYPDVIAGAISSSPTLLGAPGLGLVSQPVLLSCQTCKMAKCTAGCFCGGLLVLLNHITQTHDMLMYVICPHLFLFSIIVSHDRPTVQGYPDGCQQVLLRLRPYPVRGHWLLRSVRLLSSGLDCLMNWTVACCKLTCQCCTTMR